MGIESGIEVAPEDAVNVTCVYDVRVIKNLYVHYRLHSGDITRVVDDAKSKEGIPDYASISVRTPTLTGAVVIAADESHA